MFLLQPRFNVSKPNISKHIETLFSWFVHVLSLWCIVSNSVLGMVPSCGLRALKVFSPAQAALLDGQTSRILPLRCRDDRGRCMFHWCSNGFQESSEIFIGSFDHIVFGLCYRRQCFLQPHPVLKVGPNGSNSAHQF